MEESLKKTYVKPMLQNAGVAVNLALNEKVKKMQSRGEEVYHLAFGQSPFPIPKCFTNALKDYAGAHEYLPVTGTLELRKAICQFHKDFGGMELSPENMVVGCGTKELIFLTMQVFDGDVLLVSPGWTTYGPQVKLSGRQPIIIDTKLEHEWKVTPQLLEVALKDLKSNPNIILSKRKLLILNNPGNPSGSSYTSEEYEALVGIFRKHDIVVLSDEIYAYLMFSGNHQSLHQYYPEGTLTTCGFSKWASAGGWRVGYIFVPKEMPDMLNAIKAAGTQTFTCAPAPMQHALAKGLKDTEGLKRYLRQERLLSKAAAEFCCSHLRNVGVKCLSSQAGYYLFPDFEVCRKEFSKRGIFNGEKMCEIMLAEAKVALLPGSAFLRSDSEFTVRLCYVNFDGKAAMDAMDDERSGFNKLDDKFVEEYMPDLVEAIRRLQLFTKRHIAEV